MAENKLVIEIYRNKSIDELSKVLADPSEKADSGSAAAAVGALAASMLSRAVSMNETDGLDDEKQEWTVRNAEILRSYMVKLVDEDIKCRGPLRRALKEGDPRNIEAASQAAVCICLEIVNMMGKCLELVEERLGVLKPEAEARFYLIQSADLAYAASLAAGQYILMMGSRSPDDTYRYIIRRENELTMQEQKARLDRSLGC